MSKYDLSMKKFSSNVVEKCIKYGDEKIVKKIFNDIISNDKLENLLNKNEKNGIILKIGNQNIYLILL